MNISKINKIYYLIISILIIIGCQKDFSSPHLDSIFVRFYNNSPFNLENVTIEQVNFGLINESSYSKYIEVKKANKYSDIELEIDGIVYYWIPNDYPGIPFEPGRYLFIISVHEESHKLYISIHDNDKLPNFTCPDSISPIINTYVNYFPTSLSHHGNNFNIVATREISTWINPTIPTNPNSKLIYLPDAFIVTRKYNSVLIRTDQLGNINFIKNVGPKSDIFHFKKKIFTDSEGRTMICGENWFADGTFNSQGYPNGQIKIWWQLLDDIGDSLSLNINTSNSYFCDAILHEEVHYLITGSISNNGYMLSVDENGFFLDENILQNSRVIQTAIEVGNNSYLVSTGNEIKKLDLNFNEIWASNYNNVNQIQMLNDSTLFTLQNYSSIIVKWNFDDGIRLSSYSYDEKFNTLLWMCVVDSSSIVITAKDKNHKYCSFMINNNGEIQWERKFDIPIYFDEKMSNPLIKLNNSTIQLLYTKGGIWLIEISNDGLVLMETNII